MCFFRCFSLFMVLTCVIYYILRVVDWCDYDCESSRCFSWNEYKRLGFMKRGILIHSKIHYTEGEIHYTVLLHPPLSLSLIFEWKTCYTEDLWRYPSSHQWITFALRFEGEVPSPTTLLRARTDSEELKSFTILEDCGVWSIPRSYSISDGLIKFSVEFTVKTFVHTHNEANFGLIWSLVVGLVIKCYLLSCYFSYIWYLL